MSVFDNVGSVNPGRSVFDLSYDKKLTCDFGQLIPVLCDEMVPGDYWNIGNEIVVRFQPMVAPVMHEINCFVHYFFVPYRLLWSSWENYITGGIDGTDASVLPTWNPTNTAVGSLWDYLGFPTGIVPTGLLPMAFPKYAYNLVYNNYYRDETQIAALDITVNENILLRAWEKDYFTSALPWQQRGTAPALPISGTSHAVWPAVNTSALGNFQYNTSTFAPGSTGTKTALELNTVDLSTATTFNVSDLRLAFQVQRWMERNARAGARYTEFLKAHYGVSPRDDRLHRPEYVGGTRNGVIISEVLKTSSDGSTAQGNMAGHGITVGSGFCGSYHAQEFGLMIGILSVMPRSRYTQGIDRQWIKKTKYDFYSPEFANLSEQAVYRGELYATAVSAENNTIFGYQEGLMS